MKLYWSSEEKKWVERPVKSAPKVHLQSDWEPVESPITGEVFSGRAAYQEHLKALGHHIAEPGDVAKRPAPDREGVRQAIREARQELFG